LVRQQEGHLGCKKHCFECSNGVKDTDYEAKALTVKVKALTVKAKDLLIKRTRPRSRTYSINLKVCASMFCKLMYTLSKNTTNWHDNFNVIPNKNDTAIKTDYTGYQGL